MKVRCLFLIFVCGLLNAQVVLPIDSSTNKVTYYEVVKVDTSLTKNLLFMSAEKWVDKNLKEPEIKPDSTKILASGKFVTTEMKGILEKVTGNITYDFLIESKNGKYRYIFTNFVYHRINLDRYGKKQSEVRKKIEDKKAAGWNRQWNKYKKDLDLHISSLVMDLKDKMKINPILTPIEQKIQKKSTDW